MFWQYVEIVILDIAEGVINWAESKSKEIEKDVMNLNVGANSMLEQILDQEKNNHAIVHVEPREAVKELLTKLKEVAAQKERLEARIDQEILEDIQNCDNKTEAITAEIKDLVSFEVQESIKTNDGEAVYKKGNVRISYDRKILDAIQDEKVREAIEPARKETQVKGSVIIDIY